MSFVNTTQTYGRPISSIRPMSNIDIRQQLRTRDCFDLPGGMILWKYVGRIAVVICLVVVGINMMFGSFVQKVDQSIIAAERTQREYRITYQVLNDTKKDLWSKDNIEKMAGDKLALHAPVDGQVKYL